MRVVTGDHFAVIFKYADRGRWIPHGNKLYRIKVGIGCVPSPKTSKPALGPIQPSTQWVSLFFSGGTSTRREVDTRLHVVQSLRICGSLLLLPLFACISLTDSFTFCPQFNIPKRSRIKKSCSTLVFSCKLSFHQCFIHTAPPQGAGII
jgi:hypothetical protein